MDSGQTCISGKFLDKCGAVPFSREEVKNVAARVAANRIEQGVRLLADPTCFEAFRLANKLMAQSVRRRQGPIQGKPLASVLPPAWRRFQLAFLLMNLEGIARPASKDREVLDLLFFPTGGGKTEA